MKTEQVNRSMKLYVMVSIVYSLFGRVIPLKQLIGERVNSYVYILLALLGVCLLAVDFITTKKWKQGKYISVLYLFVGSMIVSTIINRQYGVFNNIKTIIWTILHIGLFYTLYLRCTKEEGMCFIEKIWKGLLSFWFFPAIYSLVQFITLDKYRVWLDGKWTRQGFYENRLFGVFNDPNYAAITSFCVILACIYFYRKSTKKLWKAFLIINIACQFLYIVLSGSRTILVCMVALSCIISVIYIMKNHSDEKLLKRVCKLVLYPMISTIVLISAFAIVQKASILLPTTYYYMTNGDFSGKLNVGGEEIDSSLVERKDGQSGNISNNRSTIWKAYIEGMKGDLLFGGSPRNVLEKWQEKNPNGYLAETNYETHNGYLYVLVGTGIIGSVTLLIYIFLYVKKLLKYLMNVKELSAEFMFVMSFLIVILIYVFFFTDLFFIHSLTSVLFWLHCGCLLYWIDEEIKA